MPDTFGMFLPVLFGLAVVVFAVAAIVSIVNSRGYTAGIKALWVLAVIAFPVVGSLVWFIIGRRSHG